MKSRIIALLLMISLAVSLVACSGNTTTTTTTAAGQTTASQTTAAGAKTKLTFAIWDTNQKDGMDALAAAYTKINPNVTVEVQVSNWDEYWTKLEAASSGGVVPDLFWMHTNEFVKYASNNLLVDTTKLFDGVADAGYDKFPAGLVANVTYDGKLYGVPKDWDTIGLAYNKELFDKANVKYPDDTWTWDSLVTAAKTIKEKTGVWGFGAPYDDQQGYLNTIYQAGGFSVKDGKVGYNQPGAKQGLKYWIGLQKDYTFSPDQTAFADADVGTLFQSGQVAMTFLGSWNITGYMLNKDIAGKFDIAVLPKCPNPVSGEGRATIYNGLSYAASSKGKNIDATLAFMKFLGTKDANIIHGNSGAAIPAYNGTSETWLTKFPQLNLKAYTDMMAYGVQFPNSKLKSEWKTIEKDTIMEIYNGKLTLDQACAKLETDIGAVLAKEK
jgi:multiple sugar transport system substrate-binding protein